MTPVQFRFIVRMVRKINSCIKQSAISGVEVREVVGHKQLGKNHRITLTIVTDPDAGFPAPLQSYGGHFTQKDQGVVTPSPDKLRNQHGRSNKVFG